MIRPGRNILKLFVLKLPLTTYNFSMIDASHVAGGGVSPGRIYNSFNLDIFTSPNPTRCGYSCCLRLLASPYAIFQHQKRKPQHRITCTPHNNFHHTPVHHGHREEDPQIRHNQAPDRPTRLPSQRKPRKASKTTRIPLQSPLRRAHPRNPTSTLANVLLAQHRPSATISRSHRHEFPITYYTMQASAAGNTYGYISGDGQADDYELRNG